MANQTTPAPQDLPQTVRESVDALNQALADARAEGYIVKLQARENKKLGEIISITCKSISKNEVY